jgi:histidine triad (HIT) family protein
MAKNKVVALAIAILLVVGFGVIFYDSSSVPKTCVFCDPKVLQAQTFYEDELVLALYTHKPVFPGHCLVIPKRHVERFEQLTDAEAAQIFQVIKKVNTAVEKVFGTSSYLLLEKNGVESFQTVFHVHFHYIPRKAGDTSLAVFLGKLLLVNALPPISAAEMQENVQKLKDAI